METTISRPVQRPVWTFARHFLEMCVAMCVGGWVLNALVFVAWPAMSGTTDLRRATPAVSLLVIGVNYTIPMAAWMRLQGMPWRPVVEMSAATVGVAVLLVIGYRLGWISDGSLRNWMLGFCGPACVAMIVAMLFRLDLYTGRSRPPWASPRAGRRRQGVIGCGTGFCGLAVGLATTPTWVSERPTR